MGGNVTDIALLRSGEPQLTSEKTVGVAKVALPAIDIHTPRWRRLGALWTRADPPRRA